MRKKLISLLISLAIVITSIGIFPTKAQATVSQEVISATMNNVFYFTVYKSGGGIRTVSYSSFKGGCSGSSYYYYGKVRSVNNFVLLPYFHFKTVAVHRSGAETLDVENPHMLTYFIMVGATRRSGGSTLASRTWAARLYVKGGHGFYRRCDFTLSGK